MYIGCQKAGRPLGFAIHHLRTFKRAAKESWDPVCQVGRLDMPACQVHGVVVGMYLLLFNV
jgi:hypothetical protein